MTSSEPCRLPGLDLIDHFFVAPPNYEDSEGRQLDIFVCGVHDQAATRSLDEA
jgi:hypothetical protein